MQSEEELLSNYIRACERRQRLINGFWNWLTKNDKYQLLPDSDSIWTDGEREYTFEELYYIYIKIL